MLPQRRRRRRTSFGDHRRALQVVSTGTAVPTLWWWWRRTTQQQLHHPNDDNDDDSVPRRIGVVSLSSLKSIRFGSSREPEQTTTVLSSSSSFLWSYRRPYHGNGPVSSSSSLATTKNKIENDDIDDEKRNSPSQRNNNNNNDDDKNQNQNDGRRHVPQTVQRALVEEILPQILRQQEPQNRQPDIPHIVLLVGVSGGCDSVGLLHSLLEIMEPTPTPTTPTTTFTTKKWQFKVDPTTTLRRQQQQQQQHQVETELHVVHFDHGQRGTASDGDRRFVQDWCESQELPFHCYYWKNKDDKTTTSTTIAVDDDKPFSQDTARQWRRREMEVLLQRLMMQQDTNSTYTRKGIILTAHHRDDSMESLLLKLLRGTHITNLQGMQALLPVQQRRQQQQDYSEMTKSPLDDTAIWYARPLLALSKDDIINYLTKNGYTWRDDASNQSNKYLRNRVRNELVPLLSDLVEGGTEVLYKRLLDNLAEQSQELKHDLEARGRAYLRDSNSHSRRLAQFFIPKTGVMELYHKHAFFQWVREASAMQQHQSGKSLHLSYEQLERVCHKVNNEPLNLQWQLSVGDEWNVQRQGSVLRLLLVSTANEADALPGFLSEELQRLDWNPQGPTNNANQDDQQILKVSIPRQHLAENAEFWMGPIGILQQQQQLLSNDEDNDIAKLTFSAPWWDDNRRPIKASGFLRGQKVPLHQRDLAPAVVLLAQDDKGQYCLSSTSIIALFVEPKQKWLVNKEFSPDDKLDSASCSIQLALHE